MSISFQITQVHIRRFRGLSELKWNPEPGMNIILGGGDCGKSTILEALGLLFSPNNSFTLTEADYWMRKSEDGFEIEATISVSDDFEFTSGNKIFWPWEWNGSDAVQPVAEVDEVPDPQHPVFKVALTASNGFELSWEIIQPDDTREHFSIGLRRKFGLVKLSGDDKNDRDLRLVYGSALDRLLSDGSLRSKIGHAISQIPLKDSLSDEAKKALEKLDETLKKSFLPTGLDLGVSSSQGISIGSLIGLFAKQADIQLPLASWGAGTRRMSALQIASANSSGATISLIDELERGLEPYRLRQFTRTLIEADTQSFVTTHSPIAISCSAGAQLWYLDATGNIGQLDRDKIVNQQQREPETFLAKVSVIVEGETEIGFVAEILQQLFGGDPLDAGTLVCLGQGDDQMLPVLETLTNSGIQFAGFADNDGKSAGRWTALQQQMQDRLFRWEVGCIESNIIAVLPEDYLVNLFKDRDGDWNGIRLRTVATRLGIDDKSFDAIDATAKEKNITIRDLIISAATGSVEGIEDKSEQKALKKQAQDWFKKADGSGGRELLDHLKVSGAWGDIEPALRPFFNAVLELSRMSAVDSIEL